jgi:heat shock protein HslJ
MHAFRCAAMVLAAATALSSAAVAQTQRRSGQQQQPQQQQQAPRKDKQFPVPSSWVAVSLNGRAYGGPERPAFSLDGQYRAKGFGGCNTFSATAFPLRQQGFAVGPFALTKKQCDKGVLDAERTFLTALRTAKEWDFDGITLVIKGENGELRFERSI